MPMCFNLFVPLRSAVRRGHAYVMRAFQYLLPQLNIGQLINIEIEFIPVPIDEYINDKSAFDVFVEYRTSSGEKGCIGIETKYVDALGRNNPSDMGKKHRVAIETGCFTPSGLDSIKRSCPQLIRNFLLIEKYRLRHGFVFSHSLILSLKEDNESVEEIAALKKLLRRETQSKIVKLSLEDFVDAVQRYCPELYRRWINEFYRRYLDFDVVKDYLAIADD